jgi:hypothetical protein
VNDQGRAEPGRHTVQQRPGLVGIESMNVHGTASVTPHRHDLTTSPPPGDLTEREIQDLVARCPEQMRWAFEGWLRGVRHLDGDPIESLP